MAMRGDFRVWWPPIALVSALTVVGLPDIGEAGNREIFGRSFAVATESDAASEAAMQTLQSGGHAVDAAISAALVLGVVNPTSSGIGGGGFALIWDQKVGKSVTLDFREVAPRNIDPQSLSTRPLRQKNPGALVGVPGEVAGLAEMHRRWGRKTFAQNASAAIQAAEKGFVLERHMARTLARYRDALEGVDALASIFYPQGAPLAAGVRVRNPQLGATLRGISARGPSAFYAGAVAADMVNAAQAMGGKLDARDLRSYRVVERQAIRLRWEGFEVHTMPPPSAGGLLLAQTLRLHNMRSLVAQGDGAASVIHSMAEAFRGAVADRVRFIGDPMDTPMPIANLLSDAHMNERRKQMGSDRTHAPQRFNIPEHGTTHLVVVDAQRNVVSLTSSINRSFGSKIVAPSSGVVLNDELDDFTLPEFLPTFGVTGAGPNAPRADARPTSSMCPTIVIRNGKPYLALGGSGGMRIAFNVAQAAIRVLAFDASARQAVSAPRFAIGARSTDLEVEPNWLHPRVIHDLRYRGERVKESSFPAAVQLVRMQLGPNKNQMQAAGDPRKFAVDLVR